MKRYVWLILFVAMLAGFLPHKVYADEVALPCSGSDCGPVSIPSSEPSKGVELPGNNGMPSAGEAGSAPGSPIEAPSTPNKDPIAPNEPPSPSSD